MGDNLYRGATVPDVYWRLRSYTLDPQAKVVRNLTRFTPFLYAPYAKTLCDTLNVDTAFTNPYADGQPFTGTFYGIARTEGNGEEDRSLTIVQMLVPNKGEDKSITWAENCKELRTIRYVERLTKAQLDVEVATYAACSNGNNYMLDINRTEDGLWTLKVMIRTAQYVVQQAFTSQKAATGEEETYREINKQTQAFDMTRAQGEIILAASSLNEFCYYDLERRKATSIPAVLDGKTVESALETETAKVYRNSRTQIVAQSGGQGTIYQAQQTPNQDGSYDGTLAYRLSTEASMQFASSRTLFKAEDTILYENSRTTIAAPEATGSGIYRADQTIGQDGSYDGRLTYRRGTNQGVVTFESENAELQEEDRILYRDWNEKIDAPAATAIGTVYTATNELTEDGLYHAQIAYQRNLAATVLSDSFDATLRTDQTCTYKNSPNVIVAPAASIGKVYSADQTFNLDGTYDGNMRVQESIPSVTAVPVLAATLRTDTGVLYKNKTTAIDSPVTGIGGVYRVDQTINMDGTFDGTLQYQKATPDSQTLLTERSSGRTISELAQKNQGAVISAPASSPGTIYRATSNENVDGTFDGSISCEQGTNINATVTRVQSGLIEETELIEENRTTAVEAAAAAQGVIYQATNELKLDATFNGRLVRRVSTEASLGFASERTPFRAGNRIVYENSRTKIEASLPETGMYRADQTINQDGTYNGALTYITSTGAGLVDFDSLNSNLADESRILYRDWGAVVQSPASAQSTVYESQNRLTEDGLYEATIVYRVNHQGKVEHVSESTIFRQGDAIVYRNWKTPINAPLATAPGIYRAEMTVNQDGTYDGRLLYMRPTGSGEAEFISMDSALTDETSVIYASVNVPVGSPGAGQGSIYRATNTLQDDGTYDARLVYELNAAATLEFASERMPLRTGDSILYANAQTKIDAPSATVGVYETNQQINQDGTYTGRLVYRTPIAATETFHRTDALLESQDQILYRNASDAVEAAVGAQGYIYQTANTINEDGSYDSTLTYVASRAVDHTFVRRAQILQTETERLYRNSMTPVGAEIPTAGNVYSVSQQINQDGTYDAALIYSTATAASPTVASMHSLTGDRYDQVYFGQTVALDAPEPGQGGIYRSSMNVNLDGSYEGRLVYERNDPIQVQFAKKYSYLDIQGAILYRHWPTVLEAPIGAAVPYEVGQSIEDDGTYSGMLVYTSSGTFWYSHKYRWYVYDQEPDKGVIYKEIFCMNAVNLDEAVDFLNEPGEFNLRGTEMRAFTTGKWTATRIRQTRIYD